MTRSLFILAGALLMVVVLYCRCVTVEHVQVGPGDWPGLLKGSGARGQGSGVQGSDPPPVPQSIDVPYTGTNAPPDDVQSPDEILEELLGRYED